MIMNTVSSSERHGLPAVPAPFRDFAQDVAGRVRRLGARARAALVDEDAPCPVGGFTASARAARPVDRLSVRRGAYAAIIPGDSIAETVVTSGLASTLNLYQSALVVRLILTWFPSPPQALIAPLSTICDPYLNLFRGIIPPLGGTIDLSPILAFVVLDVFTGSAAALPAELPKGDDAAARHSRFQAMYPPKGAQALAQRRANEAAAKAACASS